MPRQVLFAALCAWVFAGSPVQAQEPGAEPGLDADDPLRRHAALKQLAARGPAAKDDLDAVLELLKDGQPFVRMQAARTVVAIGAATPHAPFLVERLVAAETGLAQVIAVALADIGEPALKPLLPVLEHDNVARRRRGLMALAYFGRHGTRAIPRLLELIDDRDNVVKRRAGEALRRLAPWATDYVPEFVDALQLGSSQAKFTAARILGQLGPDAREAIPALKAAAESGTGGLKNAAAAALLAVDIRPRRKLHPALLDPARVQGGAPATYSVKFETTRGDIVVRVTRAWSPHGADRFYHLVRIGFFDDAAIFRVMRGFVAQFGLHGDSRVNGAWRGQEIPDDPVRETNRKGTVAFAKMNRPNSRATQVFFNLGNNAALDKQGFAPFGEIERGAEVAQSLNGEYGEKPDQRAIASMGNNYLARRFPRLDYIKRAVILEDKSAKKDND